MEHIIFIALLTLALAGPVDTWTDGSGRRGDVLLIGAPELSLVHTGALARDLVRHGYRVHRVTYDCAATSLDAYTNGLDHLDLGATIVVAHGFGATLALEAGMDPSGWLLVGPVLDMWPVVDLPSARYDPDAAARLYGDGVQRACAVPAVQDALEDWVARSPAPLDLTHLHTPVTILVSAGDNVAPVENTVPAAQRLSDARLVRIGVGGWTHTDLSHVELVEHRKGRRSVLRALRQLRARR